MKKKSNHEVSVVIAAYNEEPRIAEVLKVVEKHPSIKEVIVVNDGSKDKTADVVKQFDVKLINNEKNLGKMMSVKRGIEAATGDYILLLDADLKGLTKESIDKLIEPVKSGKADWSLSLRQNSLGFMKAMKMDWISGERCVPKEYLLDPLIWSRPDVGYSLEALMNKSLLAKKTKMCSVYLPELRISNKADKIGFFKGWISDFKMINQITMVVPVFEFFGQQFKMSKISRDLNKK